MDVSPRIPIRNTLPILLVMIVGSVLTAGCSPTVAQPEAAGAALTVLTEPVSASDGYQAKRTYTGRIEALRASDVGFEIGGKLIAVLVDEGNRVEAGQELARLDTERLLARRAELKAALVQARAQAGLARATLARTEQAFSERGVSRQTFDEAANAATSQGAAVDLARARLESLDVELAKSSLVAPFDAVIVRRTADEGSVLGAGQPLLSLQSTEPLRARVGVAANVADRYTVGAIETLTVEEHVYEGTVAAVLARRDAQTRTVDVLLDLDKADAAVRPGDIARLTVEETIDGTGFWVPIGSLAEGPRGLWINYVAEPVPGRTPVAYRVTPRTVELLHAEAHRAFVRGTLRADDRLIVDGLQRIVPGQLVALAVRSGGARLAHKDTDR